MSDYIEYEEVQEPANNGFLRRRYKPMGGYFMRVTRELWALEPQGRKVIVFFYYMFFWLLLIWLAIAVDLVVLIVLGLANLLLAVGKWFGRFIGKLFEKIFFKVILPAMEKTLIFSIIIILIILLIYRFEVIKTAILQLFDTIAK